MASRSLVRFAPLVLALLTLAGNAPVVTADSGSPEVVVTVERDNHAIVDFWANHNWSSRSLGGIVSEPDDADKTIEGARVSLWSLDGGDRLSGDERGKLRRLSLQELLDYVRGTQGRIKLREVGVTKTAADGIFRFDHLSAGIYSIQMDWDSLGDRQFVELTEIKPSRFHSSLASFLMTEGYRPPGS